MDIASTLYIYICVMKLLHLKSTKQQIVGPEWQPILEPNIHQIHHKRLSATPKARLPLPCFSENCNGILSKTKGRTHKNQITKVCTNAPLSFVTVKHQFINSYLNKISCWKKLSIAPPSSAPGHIIRARCSGAFSRLGKLFDLKSFLQKAHAMAAMVEPSIFNHEKHGIHAME